MGGASPAHGLSSQVARQASYSHCPLHILTLPHILPNHIPFQNFSTASCYVSRDV